MWSQQPFIYLIQSTCHNNEIGLFTLDVSNIAVCEDYPLLEALCHDDEDQ
jgi:hypothetical protein